MRSRYVLLEKDGKAKEYNVNRVWKHEPWDAMNSDSTRVLQGEKAELESKTKKDDDRIKESEIVVWAKEIDAMDSLPFGLGKVVAVESNFVKVQRLGNPTYNPNDVPACMARSKGHDDLFPSEAEWFDAQTIPRGSLDGVYLFSWISSTSS